ncbi:MAG: hypothetical protein WBW14_14340, partial [Candidatus Acidiferrum sp.]
LPRRVRETRLGACGARDEDTGRENAKRKALTPEDGDLDAVAGFQTRTASQREVIQAVEVEILPASSADAGRVSALSFEGKRPPRLLAVPGVKRRPLQR